MSGCAGSSATLRDGVFTNRDTRFAIGTLGPQWKRVDVERRADLAWHHKGHGAVIQIDASCDPGLDIPLQALTQHLLIGFTERAVVSEELTELDGREALRSRITAELDGVPRELLLMVVKKDACVYDFALVAAPGARFGAALVEFDAMLSEFSTGVNGR